MVSVIVPAFNAEKTIKRCLNSIIAQTVQEWEAIVINDGSTDNTANILNTYNDERIQVISIPNAGVSHARNVGINNASGEFISFVDSDDYLEPVFIEELSRASNGFDYVKCGSYTENVSGQIKSKNTNDLNLVVVWGGYYRRSLIINNNIRFHEKIKRQEDYLFSLQVIRQARNYSYVNKPLYHYVDSKNSLSTRYSPSLALSEELVVEEENLLVDAKPEFENKIPYAHRKVLTAVKLSYNNCCKDSTLSRQERLSYLKGLYEDVDFVNQLKNMKKNVKLTEIFRIFMKNRMYRTLDFTYRLIHKYR